MEKLQKQIHSHIGDIFLFLFITSIVLLNWKSGYFILGNDTYAPEINPQISLERYIQNPAWRSYRALGVPSDSEQADIVRVGVYSILEKSIPRWALAQMYLFVSLYIAAFGISQLTKYCVAQISHKHDEQIAGFVSGVVYTTSLIASWMYASPLYAFLAAFTFLPLLLWALSHVFQKPGVASYIILYIAILFHTIAGMVPTTFIVNMIIVFSFILFLLEERVFQFGWKKSIAPLLTSIILLIGTQLFWILPFSQYVNSNAYALTQSKINIGLTPNLVENEVKYSSFWRVPQFLFAWMDATNDDGTKQYPFAARYTSTDVMDLIGFLPLILAVIGIVGAIHVANRRVGVFIILGLIGWVLLTGVNPPFGDIYIWFQTHIPLFTQVFRWQSSKVFPMLLIPLAATAGFGVLYISRITKVKLAGAIGAFLVALMLGIFQNHYFSGELINETSRVKIPSEYYALSDFLQKTDPKSRIYIAPEANTLYFRSYSWGFFGSSFINYILPNPVIEKAMTTGSLESEDAQHLMEKAYNANNPQMFASTLRTYKTPLVLYDGYATRLHNGYFYDETKSVTVLQNNPELKLIWQKGKLRLYTLTSPLDLNNEYKLVSAGHDTRQLNLIHTYKGETSNYLTTSNMPGEIYPFALAFSQLTSNEREIIGISDYMGPSGEFQVNPPSNDDQYVSIAYDKGTHTISIMQAHPRFYVNDVDQSAYPTAEVKKYALSSQTDRISIDGYTITLADLNSPKTVQLHSDSQFMEWGIQEGPDGSQVLTDDSLEISLPISIESQIQFDAVISSASPVEVNICLFSQLKSRCINQNHAIIISGRTRINLAGGESVNTGDMLTAYIRPSQKTDSFNVIQKKITPINSTGIQKIVLAKSKAISKKIILQLGDELKLIIPKIYGLQSYQLNTNATAIGPVKHDDCAVDNRIRVTRLKNSGPLQFNSGECADSVDITLPFLKPLNKQLTLIYVNGSNSQGIPLSISLKAQKSGYAEFEDMLPYKSNGSKLQYFPLIDDAITYNLGLYSYGIGPRKSINEIEAVSFQLIPESWYSMALIPTGSLTVNAIGINESAHPNWLPMQQRSRISDAVPVLLNGWEQGWILNSSDNDVYGFFWPNLLVYAGYAITLLIGIYLLLWQVMLLVRKHRT